MKTLTLHIQIVSQENAEGADIGAGIDDIVTPHVETWALSYPPKSIQYSGGSQYMCAVEKEIFVFTFSKTSDVHAWSQYSLPNAIIDIAAWRSYCFVRCEDDSGGESIYSFNPDSYKDGFATSLFPVEITNSYQTLRSPGRWKKIYGMDVLFNGTANFQHRYDARESAEATTAISLSGDTRPGQLIPVELMTTELSFKITQQLDSEFQLNAITYYYDQLGHF